jgi:hypothetical protein
MLRSLAVAGCLLWASLLVEPLCAGQAVKKTTPKPPVEVCAYGSGFFPVRTYQVHGLACQECTPGGEWTDVGGQDCDAHSAKARAVKSAKPKGHVCSKEGGSYSIGAIFAGADDCSRCTGRAAPDDWDALEKMYFCEKLNPAGDVD